MKITNYGIINILKILDRYSDKKLPQKISYTITRNLISFQKEYECYKKSFDKLLSNYDDYIVKDNDGKIMCNDNGIPIVSDDISKDFYEELTSLLNIEIDVNLFKIPVDVFDYEDNRYDILTPKEIVKLQTIICENWSE